MNTKQLRMLAASLREFATSLEQVARGLDGRPVATASAKSSPKRAAKPKSRSAAGVSKSTKKEVILQAIRRARKDLDIATLKKRTGFDTRTINNAVYRLKKEKEITSPAKGIYRKV